MIMKLRKEFKIGLFAIVMLAALYWGINFLKGKNFFSNDQVFYAIFEQTGDLSDSSPVLIKGVRVGVVGGIRYDPRISDSIRITLRIEPKYCIPTDSRAVIFTNGIMGGKAIRIDMGSAKECLVSGDTISTIPRGRGDIGASDIDFFKDQLAELTINLGKTLDALSIILSNNSDDVHKTMRNLSSLTARLDDRVGSQSHSIKTTLRNVRDLTTTLKGNTENFNNIVRNIETLTDSLSGAQLPAMVANLNSTVTDLRGVVNKINSNDGTVGLMLNDRALYDSLVLAATEASVLIRDIKARPRDYIRISVFGGDKRSGDGKHDGGGGSGGKK